MQKQILQTIAKRHVSPEMPAQPEGKYCYRLIEKHGACRHKYLHEIARLFECSGINPHKIIMDESSAEHRQEEQRRDDH
jgi:hypothetical protein